MSDDPSRKQPKGFEPPPWEREQFEELARRRAAQADADAAAAAEAAAAVVAAVEEAPSEASAIEEPVPEPVGKIEEPAREAVAADAPPEHEAVDPRKVTAMLMELSAEEGPTMAPVRQAGKAFAGVVGGAGAAMLVLAVFTGMTAAGAETGADVAGTGAVFIAVFGLMAVGAAAWLWIRADRSRGS
jgi:hypothetical protein